MLKKTAIVGAACALLLGLFFGRDAFSYVTTSVSKVHQSVKDSVPVEFEVDRAKQAIKDLEPEIRHNMHLIAKEEVEVAKLERQLTKSEDQLTKDRKDIFRLKEALDTGSANLVVGKRVYSEVQVKTDLKNRFEHFKTSEAKTDKYEKILRARQNSLRAAREKLEAMLSQKRQLEVDVANLEARMKMIEVAQTTSDFNFDDSQLSRTKELIDNISTRLDVAEKLVNSDVQLYDRIPLDDVDDSDDDISDQITTYFNPAAETVAELERTE